MAVGSVQASRTYRATSAPPPIAATKTVAQTKIAKTVTIQLAPVAKIAPPDYHTGWQAIAVLRPLVWLCEGIANGIGLLWGLAEKLNVLRASANHTPLVVDDGVLYRGPRLSGDSSLVAGIRRLLGWKETLPNAKDLIGGKVFTDKNGHPVNIKSVVSFCWEKVDDHITGLPNNHLLTIPVIDTGSPDFAQVKCFLDFVTNPENQPVYGHCEAGEGRTGVFMAAYRMAVQKWDFQRAYNEATANGLGMPNEKAFLGELYAALKNHDPRLAPYSA